MNFTEVGIFSYAETGMLGGLDFFFFNKKLH